MLDDAEALQKTNKDLGAELFEKTEKLAEAAANVDGMKRKIADAEKEKDAAVVFGEREAEKTKKLRMEKKNYYNNLQYQKKQATSARERSVSSEDATRLQAEIEDLRRQLQETKETLEDLRVDYDLKVLTRRR